MKFYTEANLARLMKRCNEPRTTSSPYNLRERPKPTQKRLEHPGMHRNTGEPDYGDDIVWLRTDGTPLFRHLRGRLDSTT